METVGRKKRQRNKKQNQTSIDCALWLMRRRNRTFREHAAVQPTQTFAKFDQKTFAHQNGMEWWHRAINSYSCDFVVCSPFDASIYKCIFYLSDCNLRKFKAYGLWKIIDKENTALSLIAHRFDIHLARSVFGLRLSVCVVDIDIVWAERLVFLLQFISKRNILQSLIGRMKFM